jgi:hypothetical protein
MKNKISESRVIVENGEIKTIFSEEIQKTGRMSIEESRRLCIEALNLVEKKLKNDRRNRKTST